jgi:type I restriction enzyme M protein
MNKQQLAAKIWAGANELRGKVSASSYKDYMIGLIFYKYISEKEEKYLREKLYFETVDDFKELAEQDTETVSNCQHNIGYFISYTDLFSYWINNGRDFQIKDVRTALSAFNRLIGPNYKKVYDKIFDTLEKGLDTLGTIDSERTKAVRKLLNLINEIPTDGSQDYDVLGFVYEFLLKNFAANAGKAGEFYTPHEASVIMSEIIADHLKDRTEISIYDPTSGSGSLLINIGQSVSKHMHESNKVKYYAQELIENTYNLTRMNLVMRDVLPDNIIVRNGDTLGDDWPFFIEGDKDRTYDPLFVDGCCSNPPYSQSWVNDEASNDMRFKEYGVAPKSKADYAFLLHNLYHLKPDGIMTIVLPHGVLFRGGDEGRIRENLIENNNIETIIGLPNNIFFGTGIPTIIMVLKKNRTNSDVLFIDASKGFIKDGNKNKLQAKDVKKIVDMVINRNPLKKDIKYSKLVYKDEIIQNEYNLNISRYVNSSEEIETWDIYASMYGGIPNYEIDNLKKYWDVFPSLRNQLFNEKNIPYSTLHSNRIRKIIFENKDVISFIDNVEYSIRQYPNFLKRELIDKMMELVIPKEEKILANKLYDLLKDTPLIDYYSAYQILSDYWSVISLDLELLQIEGIDSLTKVDPKMVSKKNSKTKEMYEVQDGWVGRILTFEQIQESYFKDLKAKLDIIVENLDEFESEKTSLLELIDPNDKSELINEDGNIVAKKLNAVISKIKKELKNGAEFEEDTYEDIIIKINEINESIKSSKKEKKALQEKLITDTKTKIESLTEEEAIYNLVNKWINPLCDKLNYLSNEVVNNLAEKIDYLNTKYMVTYEEITKNIEVSKTNLSSMMYDLKGNQFDMKGINKFIKIMNGDNNE